MQLDELIRNLSQICGPAGFETKVAETVMQHLGPLVDEVVTDAMGNVIAYKRCGTVGAKTLMLTAHMDEVGLIITGHENGFLRFDTLGGIDARVLPAREVKILADEPIMGVIDTMPVHVLSAEDVEKPTDISKLFIDTGLTQEEAKARVPLGTAVVFAGNTEISGRFICGKALDNRSGAGVIIKSLDKLLKTELFVDICVLITVQEELGRRGAVPGAFTAAPDYCIAVDATHAHTPDAKKEKTFVMGGGCAIGVGPNMSKRFSNLMIGSAEEEGIPYQIEVMGGDTGTDAWPIQISRGGVCTAVLSIPVRYMHTPVEMMSVDDAEATVDLICIVSKKLGEEWL